MKRTVKILTLATFIIMTAGYLSAESFGKVVYLQTTRSSGSELDAFNKELERADIVVVDFYADWCGPCKQLSRSIDATACEMPSVMFLKVNIDTHKAVANNYSIRSIPQLYIFKNGKLVKKLSGNQSKAAIKKAIEECA